MKLTDGHIEELRKAAARIGAYGKITIVLSGGVVDIITEERVRIQSGYKDSAVLLRDNRGGRDYGKAI
jgi:hypothetical protein